MRRNTQYANNTQRIQQPPQQQRPQGQGQQPQQRPQAQRPQQQQQRPQQGQQQRAPTAQQVQQAQPPKQQIPISNVIGLITKRLCYVEAFVDQQKAQNQFMMADENGAVGSSSGLSSEQADLLFQLQERLEALENKPSSPVIAQANQADSTSLASVKNEMTIVKQALVSMKNSIASLDKGLKGLKVETDESKTYLDAIKQEFAEHKASVDGTLLRMTLMDSTGPVYGDFQTMNYAYDGEATHEIVDNYQAGETTDDLINSLLEPDASSA